MASFTLATARRTPFPAYRLSSWSRSSKASCAPVDAPEGTIARPKAPSARVTSASTVGFPRESSTSRARISAMRVIVRNRSSEAGGFCAALRRSSDALQLCAQVALQRLPDRRHAHLVPHHVSLDLDRPLQRRHHLGRRRLPNKGRGRLDRGPLDRPLFDLDDPGWMRQHDLDPATPEWPEVAGLAVHRGLLLRMPRALRVGEERLAVVREAHLFLVRERLDRRVLALARALPRPQQEPDARGLLVKRRLAHRDFASSQSFSNATSSRSVNAMPRSRAACSTIRNRSRKRRALRRSAASASRSSRRPSATIAKRRSPSSSSFSEASARASSSAS